MPSPYSPIQLLLFLAALGFLPALVQIGLVTIAFEKLGLSQTSAFLLLLGSSINLPLFSIAATRPPDELIPRQLRGLLRQTARQFTGRTLIAVNVGDCVIPLMFSLYLIQHHPVTLDTVIYATLLVALICYVAARPIPGVGIGIPIFVAPLVAAAVATLIAPDYSAPLAYIGGTLGVLLGADILRWRDIRTIGAPVASIGGVGTFDGIFLTGIVAVLLA